MLNRIGIYQYWNNSWINNFNSKVFLNKTLFLENLINYLFTERIFGYYFFKKLSNVSESEKKRFFRKLEDKTLIYKYNFTKIWVVKYNTYLLMSLFCFYFFKIKGASSKKKKPNLKKITIVFWKKKKGKNLKRKYFLSKNYLLF